jgi:hypothetical protein
MSSCRSVCVGSGRVLADLLPPLSPGPHPLFLPLLFLTVLGVKGPGLIGHSRDELAGVLPDGGHSGPHGLVPVKPLAGLQVSPVIAGVHLLQEHRCSRGSRQHARLTHMNQNCSRAVTWLMTLTHPQALLDGHQWSTSPELLWLGCWDPDVQSATCLLCAQWCPVTFHLPCSRHSCCKAALRCWHVQR